MINTSRALTTSLALLSFLSLLLSCTGSVSSDPSPSTDNLEPTAITGTFIYATLDIEQGTATNTSPSWTGLLANQTVTYTMVRQGEEDMPVSITINSSTGKVSVATNAVIADSGTYTITASGSGQYNQTKQTTITITIRPLGVTLTAIEGSFSYNSVDIEEGTATNANPTWTGALTSQTVTYGIVRQAGAKLPDSITIDRSTGTVSVANSALVADSDTYTITASGTGNYNGSSTTDIAINIKGDVQGTIAYSPLNVIVGTTSTAITASPSWTGALAGQTVTYTLARQDGASLPASITIDSSTGIISLANSAGFQDQRTYTVTATGTGNYRGNITADVIVTITIVINTAAELQAITTNITTTGGVQHIGGTYELGGNIDLSRMSGFTPIGSITTPFMGVFDGKGYKVNLNINSAEDNMGLFGVVGIDKNSPVEIKDIGISGTVTSTGDNVGGLVGSVNGGSIVGYSEATVSGNDNVGGLVGYNKGGTILGYATGDVSGTYSYGNTGGLVGYNKDGNILGYATGNVSSSGYFTGGLVGYINLNTVTLNITGYATGNVSGTTFAGGGLLGGTGAEISSIVVTGYATGAVTGTGSGNRIKGFIGTGKSASISARNSYFDATSTGQTDSYTTSISAATNIYKFAGPTETSGRTIGKFYDKATGISPTAEDSGDTEIFTAQGFIDAFDLANTPNGKFPKLKTSLFGSFTQP